MTFEIEPVGAMVKLTVVHDGFDADSTVAAMVSEGWPSVLSDLKTMLETQEVSSSTATGSSRGRYGGSTTRPLKRVTEQTRSPASRQASRGR